ncbi:MAG: hypothetical protein IH945_11515, partial [Armatimonadetes bacterium]|nr:hypothetical protein [Armatimonadota bacterium]
MSGFKDPEAARRAIDRIDEATQRDSAAFVAASCEAASHPDQALVNLERWLKATGSPATLYDSLTATPEVGGLLVALLGASSQMADVLTQNPEMANLVLDPAVLQERPDREELLQHARRLLAESGSYTHSLDRLRFLKQSWSLRIAAADLGGLWPEEDVWLGLSVVADVLVSCARDVVWQQTGADEDCPVSIVAMGKLGGSELNFSSDIDLIYVLDDGADEGTEKRAVRFCEALSRALSDRMGRGSLYRVDLRLRPYGSRGTLVPAMVAVEGYYERYAEPWEHLALIRSRLIAGNSKVAERWARLRTKTVFQEARGEWVVADLIAMRARGESRADDRDLKAGPGGIRDVEFLAQIMQMLYGRGKEELQTFATCDALRALGGQGVIEPRTAQELLAGYTFLRQVEHRAQLLGDRQTHSLPEGWQDREYLGRRMGFASLPSFDAAVTLHRMQIRNAYDAVLRPPQPGVGTAREQTAGRLGDEAPLVTAWIDST